MFQKINNEKGAVLILALVVLAALTMMGIAAILTSTLDMQISANEKIGMQAQYAAEAGLGEAIGRLNLDKSDALYAGVPGDDAGGDWSITWSKQPRNTYIAWRRAFSGEVKSTDGRVFYNYSVTVGLKPHDTKGGDWVAFYNHSSGYMKSTYARDGQPVYRIESIGSSGNYKSKQVIEITKDAYDYNVRGGFTANGNVDLNGTPTIDGNQHDENGFAGGSCSDPNLQGSKPGVFANGTTMPPNAKNAVVTGSQGWDRYNAATDESISTTPWGVLGITEAAFNELFVEQTDLDYNGVPKDELWVGGADDAIEYPSNYEYKPPNWPTTGSGILVVHNPNFDPTKCASGNYVSTDASDECYKGNAPAKLTLDGNVTFKGLIIADDVKLAGTVTVIGAVVSLTDMTIEATGVGNPTIYYSCEAIEEYAGGKVKNKLSWNRLLE